jgi:hypothetical protein
MTVRRGQLLLILSIHKNPDKIFFVCWLPRTGVEIHEEVAAHSGRAIQKWRQARKQEDCGGSKRYVEPANIQVMHGNGLCIDLAKGESTVGYDRIYIGAALDRSDLFKVTKLLAPDDIHLDRCY